MSSRYVGITAPFRWVGKALDVGAGQPAAVLGGVAVLALAAVLPGLPMQAMQLAGHQPSLSMIFGFYALIMLTSLLVVPPITGGLYGLFRRSERGEPASAMQVLAPFSDGSAGALILTTLLMFVINALVILVIAVVIVVLVGIDSAGELARWFQTMMEWQTQYGGDPAAAQQHPPPVPPQAVMGSLFALFGAMLAFSPLLVLLGFGSALATADAALAPSSPLQAVARGLGAAFRNALPLLLFTIVLFAALLMVFMVVGVIAGLAIGLLAALSPVAAAVVGIPLYVLFLVVTYAISFGTLYHGWKDMLGSESEQPPPLTGIAV